MHFIWLAEVLGHQGLYAAKDDDSHQPLPPTTRDILQARLFGNKKDCQQWCEQHHETGFHPAKHALLTAQEIFRLLQEDPR